MTKLADALQDCLAAVATGQARLEDCPARHPELAGELEPLLQVCQRLQRALLVEPCPLYAQAARERFLASLASRPRRTVIARGRARSQRPHVLPPDGGTLPATPAGSTASSCEG